MMEANSIGTLECHGVSNMRALHLLADSTHADSIVRREDAGASMLARLHPPSLPFLGMCAREYA